LSPRRNGEYLFNAFIVSLLSTGRRPKPRVPLTNCNEKEVFFSFYPPSSILLQLMLQVLVWILQPNRRWSQARANKDHFSCMPVVRPSESLGGGPHKDRCKCGIRIARIKLNTYFRERSRGGIIPSAVKCRPPPGALIKRAPVIQGFLRSGCCHKGHSVAINGPFWYSEHTAVIIVGGRVAPHSLGVLKGDAWVAHSALIWSRTFLIQRHFTLLLCAPLVWVHGGVEGVWRRDFHVEC